MAYWTASQECWVYAQVDRAWKGNPSPAHLAATVVMTLPDVAGKIARALKPRGRATLIEPFHAGPILTRGCKMKPAEVSALFTSLGLRELQRDGILCFPARMVLSERVFERAPRLTRRLPVERAARARVSLRARRLHRPLAREALIAAPEQASNPNCSDRPDHRDVHIRPGQPPNPDRGRTDSPTTAKRSPNIKTTKANQSPKSGVACQGDGTTGLP
jgi:hypothetical protein